MALAKNDKAKSLQDEDLAEMAVTPTAGNITPGVETLKKLSTSAANSVPATIGNVTLPFPFPFESSSVFASLPEWIVEDMADFALFSLQWVIFTSRVKLRFKESLFLGVFFF